LKRLSEIRMETWFMSAYRKPLIIRGARQVGKSTLVRNFAAGRGLVLHEVNLERHPMAGVFGTNDTARILKELEFICGKGPIAGESALLFLDEIQATPDALQALRYLHEDHPELAVVAAGSLLEFTLADHSFSMPVGRIEYLFMEPMTFEELLAAMNETDLLEFLRSYRVGTLFPDSAHARLLEIQRIHLLFGGMPEAVQRFLETEDPDQVFDVHASIMETYRDDFAKYGGRADMPSLRKVFDFIPMIVGEKFKYSRVDPGTDPRRIRAALELLMDAQVVRKVAHTNATDVPLTASINPKIFKTYMLDCGLMNQMRGIRWFSMEQLLQRGFVNEGALAEQYVAQHLSTLGKDNARMVLTYWLREGRSSNAEVDFLLQEERRIIPIEVKAGRSGTLRSLLQFAWERRPPVAVRFDLNKPSYQEIHHSLRQADSTVEVQTNLLSLPLYMVQQLPRLIRAAP